jgi:methylated-DNA-protein-cysteine methyltransferase-like protein
MVSMKRVHGDIEGDRGTVRDEVLSTVRAIPRGRVTTYGRLSQAMGGRISPVAVGWMLHRCPDDVPWHRVVNAAGRCSTERLPDLPMGLQQALLEGEGVEFSLDGQVDLDRYVWDPLTFRKDGGAGARR